MTQAERITALEVKVEASLACQREINTKLDDLLYFKNRGLGAFWLATAIVSSGIIGFIATLINWIKG